MKKFLLLISVILVVFQFIGYAQTGFDVLWKIDNWGATHKMSVSTLARFSPDGKSIYFVADSSYDKLSRVYQISSETGEPISQSEGTDKIYDFDMSEAGNIYITLYSKSAVGIWDAKSHKLLDSINTDASTRVAVLNIAISPDEKYLIYNFVKKNGDKSSYIIAVYDITTKKIIKEISSIRCTELRYSRDGKTFVAGGVAEIYYNGQYIKKERLILYDATTWEEKAVLAETFYNSGFNNIHYSFDSKYVASTGTNLGCIYNIETQQSRLFSNHPTYGEFEEIQFLQDAKDYYITYSNSTLQALIIVIYNDDKAINSFSKDYTHITTGSYNKNFKIFVRFGGLIGVLIPSPTSVNETHEPSISIKYSEDYLSVSNSGIESQTANLVISNVSGKDVYSGVLELNESGVTKIPLKLDNGIYLYKFVTDNREFTGKFVVAE